jgi:membrane protease YdiL (CAAX protease family)
MRTVDIREETIFSLFRRADLRPRSTAVWWWMTALVLLGWLGAVAYIGRLRPNEVASLLSALAPGDNVFVGAITGIVLLAIGARVAGARPLAGASLVVAAFLFGHQLNAWLHPWLPGEYVLPLESTADGLRFATARLAYAATVTGPMLLAWWIGFGREPGGRPGLCLRWGDFGAAGRDVSAKKPPAPWGRELVRGYAVFCLILFVAMQANAGFGPVRTGVLWGLLPAVVFAALGNALAEELIFRGVMQPAFIRAGGVAAGLWLQGLFFGLMHWGLSVGVLSALPVSLLIGCGSVLWGKAALDTRGLGWVVIAHAMVDVAIMGAFFVPRS